MEQYLPFIIEEVPRLNGRVAFHGIAQRTRGRSPTVPVVQCHLQRILLEMCAAKHRHFQYTRVLQRPRWPPQLPRPPKNKLCSTIPALCKAALWICPEGSVFPAVFLRQLAVACTVPPTFRLTPRWTFNSVRAHSGKSLRQAISATRWTRAENASPTRTTAMSPCGFWQRHGDRSGRQQRGYAGREP